MYKKRLLKVNMNGKKRFVTALGLSLIMTTMLGMGASANNSGDTPYNYTGQYGFATETRDKTDYSSAYIYHLGAYAANVEVRSGGGNYTANGGSYYVPVGAAQYLPNYVKENGRSNCYLYIRPSGGQYGTLHGWWSPDSV